MSEPDLDAILSDGVNMLDVGPDLDSLLSGPADPPPDPLDAVEYTGDLEEDAARELTALEESYRARAKREADRVKDVGDPSYWFAVCFASEAQKLAFMDSLRVRKHAIRDYQYIDGRVLASAMGINLP